VDHSQVPSGNTVPINIRSTHRSNEYWTIQYFITSYGFDLLEAHNFLVAGRILKGQKIGDLTAFRTNLLVAGSCRPLNTADGEIRQVKNLLTFELRAFWKI